jgi:hypothetical protein
VNILPRSELGKVQMLLASPLLSLPKGKRQVNLIQECVLCPSADTIPGICPAVNDISAQENLGEDIGGTVPPRPHSGLMTHMVDVRTHSWMRLTWRLPLGNDNNGLASSICTLPSSDLGKMFTQINVEVRRMCQSEL